MDQQPHAKPSANDDNKDGKPPTPHKKESREELEQRLKTLLGNVERLSTTESIGRRNVVHRRTQSISQILALADSPEVLRHRVRSPSVSEYFPSLLKFAPGSHLLDDFVAEAGCLYLSLWLLPPEPLRKQLTREIAKLSLQYSNTLKSSAPFVPHVTIVGSIKCDTQREASDLGKKFQKLLKGTGAVPCRFKRELCQTMYDDHQHLIWSQSCIAIMERSDEFMNLLAKARYVLNLPPGEWQFPAPAQEPHFSKLYYQRATTTALPDAQLQPPQDFSATEAALFLTTPGTVPGVSQWKEIARIPLL